jgi:hypothetical protein
MMRTIGNIVKTNKLFSKCVTIQADSVLNTE